MKVGDIVKHCKRGYSGIIIDITNDYAEILWTYPGMYNPELIHIRELEVANEN